MLPDEVRKAVDVVESHADDLMHCIGVLHAFKEMRPVGVEFSKAVDELKASTQTIRAHLLSKEAVSTELRTMRGEFAKQFKRAERAEALLRECLTPGFNEISLCARMRDRITAHLSENSRDA